MKTKSLVLAALAGLCAMTAVADNDPSHTGLSVIPGKPGLYKLVYDGGVKSAVDMVIYNSTGKVVYKETLRNIRGFIRPVNFTGMAQDTYTIEVSNSQEKMKTKVEYSLAPSKPFVKSRKLGEDKYAILVSNAGEGTIEVKIYDIHRKLVSTHVEKVKNNFGKVFNLSKVKSPGYTFEIHGSSGLISAATF